MSINRGSRFLINTQRVQNMSADTKTRSKVLTIDNLSPNVAKLQYAVRGPLYLRALQIEKDLKNGVEKPFSKTIRANVGDGQAMGQKPITFIRQILACVSYPELIKTGDFPKDVKAKAEEILSICDGKSIGSYTTAVGFEGVRKWVADYIEKRDGFPAVVDDICLTPGASIGIKNCLQLLVNDINGKPSGVMIPVPQYPLYSASLAEYGLNQVDYYLDESRNWGLSIKELQKSLDSGSKGSKVRAIVVINPGNPTGQVLTKENIVNVIKFAYENSLIIFADEVYQHNIYDSEFYSFKRVLKEIGSPYDEVELLSFMSTSKGYMGECGLRGGWLEIMNMDSQVKANLFKLFSARLCPSTLGQAVVGCVVNPPKEGEESFELFMKEKGEVLGSLKLRAQMIEEMFNNMDGFSCNKVQGAMYAFPRFELPPKAIEAAKLSGQEPDVFYAFRLLEETGICVVPGSGFGQEDGTYHFRTTILPQTDILKDMVDIFQKFHKKFTKEFS